MTLPELSIITVSYNDPAGLEATLRSLRPLESTQLSWEHIVVDSSPAINKEVVKSVSTHWPLKYVEDVPPQGIYSAHNLGANSSSGKYIWFLNGGDLLADIEIFKKVFAYLAEKTHLDLLCAGMGHIRHGKFLYSSRPAQTFSKSLLGANRIYHPSMIYKKASFEKVGPFDTQFPIAADYDHHFRCYFEGLNVECVSDVLSHHDTSGLSSESYKKALGEVALIHQKARKKLPFHLALKDWVGEKKESLRINTIKRLAKTSIGKQARPLWIWYKNRIQKF